MRRRVSGPRPGWQEKLARAGCPPGALGPGGWDESVHYELSRREADEIEAAAAELHARAMEAVEHVIHRERYEELGIPEAAVTLIERSWESLEGQGDPSIYGRLDLAYDGQAPPKLLEYDADSPTGLPEAAVLEPDWLEDLAPGGDRADGLHRRLVAGWRDLKPHLRWPLHFGCGEAAEDLLTTRYLQRTAEEAGIATRFLALGALRWDARQRCLVDGEGGRIGSLFKLCPWEHLLREPVAEHLAASGAILVEPAWKLVLSGKGILPVLWELFPGHPNLLPAFFDDRQDMTSYARKPLFGRAGEGVTIVESGQVVAQAPGAAGAEEETPCVYQALAQARGFTHHTPVVGAWMVEGHFAGFGMREARGRVTGVASPAVPHLVQ